MSEDDIEKLQKISEMLNTMDAAVRALNRVMTDQEPDPDDVAFLNAFANDTLDDEDDEWLDDEEDQWIDDTWDNVMQSLPWQLIIAHKS